MTKRKRRQARPEGQEAGQTVEEMVDAAARELAERFDRWPEPWELAEDPDFLRVSDRLAEDDVAFELVWRFERSPVPSVAAMAHRAVGLRSGVPPGWLGWAFDELVKVYAGELIWLLRAIEEHGEPPFVAPVLARCNEHWAEGWAGQVIRDFVERRVRAGEQPTPAELAAAAVEAGEQLFAGVVDSLRGVLPDDTVQGFAQWRAGRERRMFLHAIGRMWEPRRAEVLTSVGGRDAVVTALRAAVAAPEPRSVLVVGEHGVGKSAVVRASLEPLHDDGWLIFEASAPEIQAGCESVGQLETRVRDIAAHTGPERLVWVLPQFEGALWTGQHSRSPRGLLDALLPYVESGRLTVVGELEPKAYELLVRQRPRVASLFEKLELDALQREEVLAVARDWRDHSGVDVDDATIADAYDLAQHYLASVAAPAGLLRLLRAAARDEGRIRSADVLATLSETTGLPLHVVDPELALDLDHVRSFFASRVLGQPEAVDCLVERIALVKASLTDPTRPLGVFLFVGPTGTGKTEIAKALAEFLFGSADRLVRLDMSEFQTAWSLERLLADSSETQEAAALISSVRAKPFSVVLLDEFEKAHRSVWNVFLQLFDDGRLTDHQGRTTDFRQCVVILTSNAGAAVESGTPLGFSGDAGARFRPARVERDVARIFAPELLNRIDQVVIFRPLERHQMRALLERELAQVLDRRGFRNRPWAVEWDEAALEFLVDKGFSAELGARPLKRAVERYLLAPLARAIVSRSFPEGEQFLFITARNERIEVSFVDPDADGDEPPAAAPASGLRLERLVLGAVGGSEERAFLQAETERLRAILDGEAWAGVKERDLELIRSDEFWQSAGRFGVLARIEYVDRVQAAFRTAESLAARLSRLGRNGHGSARSVVALLAERLYLLDRACSDANAPDPADAFLEIRATGADRAETEFAQQLQEMYESWAQRRGMRVRRLWSDTSRLLAVSGIGAYQVLLPETGLHVSESPHDERTFDRVAVAVAVAPWLPGEPAADLVETARRALAGVPAPTTVVRRYRTKPSPLVRDSVRDWRTGRLDRVLAGEFDVIVAE